MKLYEFKQSGNCYKTRLFLSILAIDYTRIPVDLAAGENLDNGFLVINPDGLVPVLIDGHITIHDSAAIADYLARTYADDNWLSNYHEFPRRTLIGALSGCSTLARRYRGTKGIHSDVRLTQSFAPATGPLPISLCVRIRTLGSSGISMYPIRRQSP